MRRLALFVALFRVSLVLTELTNFADVDCGMRVPRLLPQTRIVGGVDASQGEFPWIVSLTRSGGHFCGGTIVNKHWVLTAAHCLCSGTDVLGTNSLRVTLGEHNLRQDGDLELKVTRAIQHPEFRCAQYNNDIALLELSAAIPWSENVQPACFPSREVKSLSQQVATVAGWGWTDQDSSIGIRPDILRKVKLTILDNRQCQDWYLSQGKKVKIRNTQMCAGREQGGIDACWADSGGPLMIEEGLVVGVISTGIGCARPRLPGLYTRVSHFLQWISSSISDCRCQIY